MEGFNLRLPSVKYINHHFVREEVGVKKGDGSEEEKKRTYSLECREVAMELLGYLDHKIVWIL